MFSCGADKMYLRLGDVIGVRSKSSQRASLSVNPEEALDLCLSGLNASLQLQRLEIFGTRSSAWDGTALTSPVRAPGAM